MAVSSYAIGLLLATISLILYSKSYVLLLFYTNAPVRLEQNGNFGSSEILFADTVQNCEDAAYSSRGQFFILSCDPGRDTWNTVMGVFEDPVAPPETGLYLLSSSPDAKTTPSQLQLVDFHANPGEWHPLGVDYLDEGQRVFVANHGLRDHRHEPTIEIFRVLAGDHAAVHLTTIQHPLIMSPNAIAAINEREFFVTNDHYFPCGFSMILCKLETYLTPPGGSLVYVRLDPPGTAIEEIKVMKRIAGANGIALLNASSLAVVELSDAAVNIYDITHVQHATPVLRKRTAFRVPFFPDNIKADANGKLLIAGHPHPPAIEKVAHHARFCQGPEAEEDVRCKLDYLSWVVEWSEADGLRTIFSGSTWGSTSTAIRDEASGSGFAMALYGKGIMRWKN